MAIAATTVHRGPKPFNWTYSKLKNWRVCPKRYWHCDVQKDFKDEEGEQLLWGNAVHKALAERIAKGHPLPKGMEQFEHWCVNVLDGAGEILVEQKLALTADFKACGFFDRDVWFRGIGDVIKITGRVALVLDWKTGKIIEDSEQLALMAACVFARFPDVLAVRSEFVWLKEDATTSAIIKRPEMAGFWAGILPEIRTLQNAHDTSTFPAKPGFLCKRYCAVTACAHHGT